MERIIRVTTVYILWVVAIALALFVAYQLFEIMVDFAFLLRLDFWKLKAIRNFGLVTIGLLWLIFVMATEGYCRLYLQSGRHIQCLKKTFTIEIALAIVLVFVNGLLF